MQCDICFSYPDESALQKKIYSGLLGQSMDKRHNIVSYLALFARIVTMYSFHRVFWHYTTLPKPFLCFPRYVHNSCPKFHPVLVRLSQSLRGHSVPLIRLECVVIFGQALEHDSKPEAGIYLTGVSAILPSATLL